MRKLIQMALGVSALTMLVPGLNAQFGPNGTTSLSVTVANEAAISVTTATTTLTGSAAAFSNFTGTTNFSYKVRTTKVGGSGTITAEVTTDFPAGGPSVAAPLAGDALTYGCSVGGVGTACSGSVTPSATAATNVVTFAANTRSSKAGDSGTVTWTLPDDPQYQTGAYTATVTFTIAAL
jgi:hypothetical protein